MMGKPDVMLANAHEYLNMFGHTVIAWMWLMQVCKPPVFFLRFGASSTTHRLPQIFPSDTH
jgi:hypothetical protein